MKRVYIILIFSVLVLAVNAQNYFGVSLGLKIINKIPPISIKDKKAINTKTKIFFRSINYLST